MQDAGGDGFAAAELSPLFLKRSTWGEAPSVIFGNSADTTELMVRLK